MKIEYSSEKNRINIQRHKISLADAEPVLYDPMAITIDDPDHDEFRYVTIGMDALMRIIVVAWTECDDDCCRLISARKAESHEIKTYP